MNKIESENQNNVKKIQESSKVENELIKTVFRALYLTYGKNEAKQLIKRILSLIFNDNAEQKKHCNACPGIFT